MTLEGAVCARCGGDGRMGRPALWAGLGGSEGRSSGDGILSGGRDVMLWLHYHYGRHGLMMVIVKVEVCLSAP